MNAIETLQSEIQRAVPSAWAKLRRPRAARGMWWLDLKDDEHLVVVQWSEARGFGVSASLSMDGFGEGPEETFDDRIAAQDRIIELLRTKAHTVPPPEVALRELRGLIGMTQEDLAGRLGVQQAAVSRLERREDITLASLRRYVAALGAELEITARAPNGRVVRLLDPSASRDHGVSCEHMDHGLPLAAAIPSAPAFSELQNWLGTIVSTLRKRWPTSSPDPFLESTSSRRLAWSNSSKGSVAIDLVRAWQLSRTLEAHLVERTEPGGLRAVVNFLLAHEVGHYVIPTAFDEHSQYRQFLNPELRADVVAGWFSGYTNESPRLGIEVLRAIGCRAHDCSYPELEERWIAYLSGHIEGAKERSAATRLNLLVIRASNLELSRTFYEHLGFALKQEKHGQGPSHYSCSIGDTIFELYPCTGRAVPSTVRLGLRLSDAKSAIDRLRSEGLLREAPRMVDRECAPTVCIVKDPDGNSIELEVSAAA